VKEVPLHDIRFEDLVARFAHALGDCTHAKSWEDSGERAKGHIFMIIILCVDDVYIFALMH
jgi:hypothetical protein